MRQKVFSRNGLSVGLTLAYHTRKKKAYVRAIRNIESAQRFSASEFGVDLLVVGMRPLSHFLVFIAIGGIQTCRPFLHRSRLN